MKRTDISFTYTYRKDLAWIIQLSEHEIWNIVGCFYMLILSFYLLNYICVTSSINALAVNISAAKEVFANSISLDSKKG